MLFRDRIDAGQQLADRLRHLRNLCGNDWVVLGLPPGGVAVASAVARDLGAALDVIVISKLGIPAQPAVIAAGEDSVRVVDATGRAELDRWVRQLRRGRLGAPLTGRTAVIVDDGVTTGATASAACREARTHGAARVILAAPVVSASAAARLTKVADQVVCVATPEPLYTIDEFYDDFRQVTDDEVIALLAQTPAAPTLTVDANGDDIDVTVPAAAVELPGRLTVPARAIGLVAFANGSGSGRLSVRNRHVASILHGAGIGTLLFDLLTPDEEVDRHNVFDIDLLTIRLGPAVEWLRRSPWGDLPVGLFGAGTGAAAALWAATEPGSDIAAIVSRGGRPDLAHARLGQVDAPTLLIVGGADDLLLDLNRRAQARLRCTSQLAVFRDITQMSEKPVVLRATAQLARDWFATHLRRSGAHARTRT